ncbi:MAG: Na+/H+ antiporter subunit E [Erysipelotrichaceae bacterium]|nr:Na+/H+ antiporter subunit E [Erysipelotrichaceae bacterium]
MVIGMLLLWIIFNGRITLEILLFGIVICCAICLLLSKLTNRNLFQYDRKLIMRIYYRIRYYAILIVEIIKANLQVMDIILTPGKIEIEPVMKEFDSNLKHSSLNALLANSITLTPGTITVDVHQDRFLVLGLDSSFLEGIESSVFVEELKKMDEKGVE